MARWEVSGESDARNEDVFRCCKSVTPVFEQAHRNDADSHVNDTDTCVFHQPSVNGKISQEAVYGVRFDGHAVGC